MHRGLLLEAGIPADKIILEDSSTNTLENVTFALPLIEQVLLLSSLKTVLIVCKWTHSRRALMTLKQHMPKGFATTRTPMNPTALHGKTGISTPVPRARMSSSIGKGFHNISNGDTSPK